MHLNITIVSPFFLSTENLQNANSYLVWQEFAFYDMRGQQLDLHEQRGIVARKK